MERYPTPDMESHAGFLDRRFEAFFVDGILISVAMGILGYVLGALTIGGVSGGFGTAYLVIVFVSPFVLLGYKTAFEGYYGQTLGKRLRGIVVVNDDGSDVGWFGAIVRNALRIVDALPAFYLIGLAAAYLTDNSQRLGDLAGGTVVVNTEN